MKLLATPIACQSSAFIHRTEHKKYCHSLFLLLPNRHHNPDLRGLLTVSDWLCGCSADLFSIQGAADSAREDSDEPLCCHPGHLSLPPSRDPTVFSGRERGALPHDGHLSPLVGSLPVLLDDCHEL